MHRREAVKLLLASSLGSAVLTKQAWSQTCGASCFTGANVMDFGAVGDGTTDDLPAFQAAYAALGSVGGILTGPQKTYRLGGTLSITHPVTLDFFNTTTTYTPGTGAILFSNTNAPILSYPSTSNAFVGLRNINIVGTIGGSTLSQDGVVVANGGVRVSNVSIFKVGRYGLNIQRSYACSYENLYVQECGHSGVLIDTHCGANTWKSIGTVACGSTGFNINSADGADILIGLASEQNQYGIVFGPGVDHWNFIGTHTEHNSINSVLFKAGSNKNRVDFVAVGAGESLPVNLGGAQNTWTGGV